MNAKLTDTQLKKLKTADKNKVGTTMRMSLKISNGKDLPHKFIIDNKTKNKAKKYT